jgi:hypothetical protein
VGHPGGEILVVHMGRKKLPGRFEDLPGFLQVVRAALAEDPEAEVLIRRNTTHEPFSGRWESAPGVWVTCLGHCPETGHIQGLVKAKDFLDAAEDGRYINVPPINRDKLSNPR